MVTSLWGWSRNGVLVATNDNNAALEDLKWLNVEPDELVDIQQRISPKDVVEDLVETKLAYPCYCTGAELREMPSAPKGHLESTLYDGRCRTLSLADQKILAKAGRKPTLRLRVPDEMEKNIPKRLVKLLPKKVQDFVVLSADNNPTTGLSAVLNDRDAETTHTLLHESDMNHVYQRSLIAQALGLSSPEFVSIPDVVQVGTAMSGTAWKTVASLRDAGYHPSAVSTALLQAGWTNPKSEPLKDQAKDFKLTKLAKTTAEINLDALQEANSNVIQDMDGKDRVDAVFEHLARRGFAFSERDRRWRTKFVDLVVEDLSTLADAENMAGYVLTSTVSYDKAGAEMLRGTATQDLIDNFEDQIKAGKVKSSGDWKAVLAKFRGQVEIPGRALSTIRLVLTGERSGPNLVILATLLGEDGIRHRLEKARKYRS
jgi:nondiscriminating glutamyl-tRNA synthetase